MKATVQAASRPRGAKIDMDPTAADGPGTFAKRPLINPDLRRRMISEAAYYRAEARHFADGYELEDWLEAEAEVERLIASSSESWQD